MWTLSQARTRLSDRLGEVSTVFWSDSDRTAYLNSAQKFVASVTRGVSEEVTGTVNSTSRFLTLPPTLLNAHPLAGYVGDGDALSVVPVKIANAVAPDWRTMVGNPKWFVLDLQKREAHVYPAPTADTNVTIEVAVLPDDMADPSDELFNGTPLMERYQEATIQLAATYALLKERYDQDAERFYQFFMQEFQALGVNPNEIPTFQEVRQNVNVEG